MGRARGLRVIFLRSPEIYWETRARSSGESG